MKRRSRAKQSQERSPIGNRSSEAETEVKRSDSQRVRRETLLHRTRGGWLCQRKLKWGLQDNVLYVFITIDVASAIGHCSTRPHPAGPRFPILRSNSTYWRSFHPTATSPNCQYPIQDSPGHSICSPSHKKRFHFEIFCPSIVPSSFHDSFS